MKWISTKWIGESTKRKKVPYDLRWIVGNLFFMRFGIGGLWECGGERLRGDDVGMWGCDDVMMWGKM